MKSKIFCYILTLLGFGAAATSCVSYGPAEYGMPWAEFEVKGKVTDAEDKPIKGIKVSVDDDRLRKSLESDFYSDENGNYVIIYGNTQKTVGEVVIIAEDIDGEDNGGLFERKELSITIEDEDYTGSGNWYKGKATKALDIELESTPKE